MRKPNRAWLGSVDESTSAGSVRALRSRCARLFVSVMSASGTSDATLTAAWDELVVVREDLKVQGDDLCCKQVNNLEGLLATATGFAIAAIYFFAMDNTYKGFGTWNPWADKPLGGKGKLISFAVKHWTNVVFVATVSSGLAEARIIKSKESYRTDTCANSGLLDGKIDAVLMLLGASRWALIRGVIGDFVMIEAQDLKEECDARRKRNQTSPDAESAEQDAAPDAATEGE